MEVVYIGLFVAVGLLMDWAVFERIMTSGEVLWSVRPGYRYRATLFPRTVLTLISCAVFGVAVLAEPVNNPLFVAGTVGFLASLIYAIVRTSIRKNQL